ncbi:hypothetical protein ACFLTZ_04935 [Chloroflexota bacterium]
MPLRDWFVLMGMGGLFILIGLAAIVWGKNEEKGYYDSLPTHTDTREFLERSPKHPEPTALKIGGWIAIAIGSAVLLMGGGFWLWGFPGQ